MTTWPLKPKQRASMVDYAVLTVVQIQSFKGRFCYNAIYSPCIGEFISRCVCLVVRACYMEVYGESNKIILAYSIMYSHWTLGHLLLNFDSSE